MSKLITGLTGLILFFSAGCSSLENAGYTTIKMGNYESYFSNLCKFAEYSSGKEVDNFKIKIDYEVEKRCQVEITAGEIKAFQGQQISKEALVESLEQLIEGGKTGARMGFAP